jgi:RimJ/RimL family protein N-acetyltransferase
MDLLETPRLILRPLSLADAEQVQRIFPHWEVVRYLTGVPWPYPADGALTYYRDFALPAMEQEEEWHWTLRLKSAPEEVIGQMSLMRQENNNRGFWLGLPWQRRGYMSEAVEVATDYWFNTLGFPVVRAPKAIRNTASRRISEKSVCVSLLWRNETTSPVDLWLRFGRSRPRNGGFAGAVHGSPSESLVRGICGPLIPRYGPPEAQLS